MPRQFEPRRPPKRAVRLAQVFCLSGHCCCRVKALAARSRLSYRSKPVSRKVTSCATACPGVDPGLRREDSRTCARPETGVEIGQPRNSRTPVPAIQRARPACPKRAIRQKAAPSRLSYRRKPVSRKATRRATACPGVEPGLRREDSIMTYREGRRWGLGPRPALLSNG